MTRSLGPKGPLCPLLYIDDNAVNQALMQSAIARTRSRFTLYSADGADTAAKYFGFHRQTDVDPFPRPGLILLDYELGDHTGTDFLIWLRVMRQITSIPVIMYSGSCRYAAECYRAGASHFLRKPATFEGIARIVRALHHCMFFNPPRFELLCRLPDYQPQVKDEMLIAA